MSKTYWIHIDMNDYRSGRNIYTYIKPPRNEDDIEDDIEDAIEDDIEDDIEESAPYTFEIPKDYRIYIIADYPEYKIKAYINTKKKDRLKKLYLKMYSQIYDCLPFEVTGHNSAYKEEGFYPEISEDIKKMPEIKIIEKLKEKNKAGDYVYFVFAIDSNGDEIFTEML